MPKKIYNFNYDYYKAEVKFEVDLETFTPEMAYETLTFFSWDYDEDEDPVDEVMKKYAMAVIKVVFDRGIQDVASLNNCFDEEGFGRIDGSIGISAVSFKGFEFHEFDLVMEITSG
jgi:hypothetical protein